MISSNHLFICLVFCFLYCHNAYGQISNKDSTIYQQGLQYPIRIYKQSLKENLRLYSGSEYVQLSNGIVGTPFFKYDSLELGSILYNGILYYDVPMRYDIQQDAVVINDYSNKFPIKLISEQITEFKLANHFFVRLAQANTAAFLSDGFYEVLKRTGNAVLYAKRKKSPFASARTEEKVKFIQEDQFYIEINNNWYAVKNKQSLLAAFSGKKDVLKKYLSENHFDYRKNLETAIINTMEYYMKLKD